MARRCTVCDHANRREIDASIIGNDAFRRVAARYSLSEASVRRHVRRHLSRDIAAIAPIAPEPPQSVQPVAPIDPPPVRHRARALELDPDQDRLDRLRETVQARAAAETARQRSLLEQVQDLRDRSMGLLDRAEQSGDLKTALAAIREMRENLQLLFRLTASAGAAGAGPVDLVNSPEWARLRTGIMDALTDYPKARAAVAAVGAALSEAAS